MPSKIDVVGLRFARLVVIAESSARTAGRRKVYCVCDCGKTLDCDPRNLRSGHTKSCGCFHRGRVAVTTPKHSTTHGSSKTREYNIWTKMRNRCSHPADKKYKDYGARGIKVCERWESSFEAFISDMGLSPSRAHSIERNDVNGDYEPSNCRWATPLEQSRNKRNHRMVTFGGREVPLSQACEEAGINYRSALYRLNRGLDWMPLPAAPVTEGEA